MAENHAAGDPFEMFRRIWGPLGLPVPGMAMPTLDPAEVDKRIAELRSVESWLTLNLNMVRLSIQGLEVQKAALAAMRGGAPAGGTAAAGAAKAEAQKGASGAARGAAEAAQGAAPGAADLAGAMLWPWQLMQQMMTAGGTTSARAPDVATPARGPESAAPDTEAPSQPEDSPAAAPDAGAPRAKKA